MKTYPCIESTLEWLCGNYEVRLWIDMPDVDSAFSADEVEVIRDTINRYLILEERGALYQAARQVCSRLNAMQIRRRASDGMFIGVVVYYTEFSAGEDPHG